MSTDVKQPVAWELHGKLREFVDMRPNMQREEWEHKFSNFWSHSFKDLGQPEARLEMFDALTVNGLVRRHYASELDAFKANNDGWRAKIADISFVCSAFPVCDVGVCHHRSIGHRRGYEDKNGRIVPSHPVRSFFVHRGQLSQRLNEIHKAEQEQRNHDTAIDIMVRHLSNHRSGFYIIDRCPKCKKEFEPLRIFGAEDIKPKYKEYDEQGVLRFEYDIGVIGEDGELKAIFEALNTHKMGSAKRAYANDKACPWIEYSVSAMMSNEWKGVRPRRDGWLALEALKLKMTHSGASHCDACAAELEKERADADRRERIRRRINDGEEARRNTIREIVEPAEQELIQITQKLENTELGFSIKSQDKMERELANSEVVVREVLNQLWEAEQVVYQLHTIENEVDAEMALRKDKSFCSKTGLELSAEFNETVISGFNRLSARIAQLNSDYHELLALIDMRRRELISFSEAIALGSHLAQHDS
jgi:ssDNA-binding Zn-finger/Zn-ribbon topoisomerase 1